MVRESVPSPLAGEDSSPLSSPVRDCVAIHEWPILVISSGARDLAFSATCEEKISRLGLEMTIATQFLKGEEAQIQSAENENV
jgi:hypothetical protein